MNICESLNPQECENCYKYTQHTYNEINKSVNNRHADNLQIHICVTLQYEFANTSFEKQTQTHKCNCKHPCSRSIYLHSSTTRTCVNRTSLLLIFWVAFAKQQVKQLLTTHNIALNSNLLSMSFKVLM